MNDFANIIGAVTAPKSRENRADLRLILICVVLKINAHWVMTKKQSGNLIKKLPKFGLQALAFCDNFLASVWHTASGLKNTRLRILQPVMFHGCDFVFGKIFCPEDFRRERNVSGRDSTSRKGHVASFAPFA